MSTPGGMSKLALERCRNIFDSFDRKPKLCVIDLDYTLWPCYCECTWETPRTYPEAIPVLESIQDASIPIAVASRSPTPHTARRFLQDLGLYDHFIGFEVYSTRQGKDKHLNALSRATGIQHEDMVFFDDEPTNIEYAQRQGVTSVLVEDGLTVDSLRTAMDMFNNQEDGSGKSA